jgi:hypothetical protein
LYQLPAAPEPTHFVNVFRDAAERLRTGLRYFVPRPATLPTATLEDQEYCLLKEPFNPVVEPLTASLGQVGLRDDAAFYLLTRYFVQCLNTGALAVFRFKFNTSVQDCLYSRFSSDPQLKLARTDTLGYMLWYLKYVYKRQGWTARPGDASYKEDLQVMVKFWQRELKHKGSLLWCTEIEQRVLV